MGIGSDLKSLFVDDFKAGVEQTSRHPIVYIDPDKFDKEYLHKNGVVNPKDIPLMREMLDSQKPGFTKDITDNGIKGLIKKSINGGPFAGYIANEGVCLVNGIHRDLDMKTVLIPAIAKEELKNVPGWEDHYERMVGVHEGQHCNQGGHDSYIKVLAYEAESDQKAIDWAKENGLNEIATSFSDYRALGARSGIEDLEHATGIFLNLDGSNPDGLDKIKAAASFKDEMFFELALREEGMSFHDAKMASLTNPAEFAQEMEKALNEGAFKRDNPYVEKFVRDYVEGIKATGVPVDAEKNISDAVRDLDTEMMFEVMATHEVDYAQALKMREENPELFAKTIEDGLKNGAFDRPHNPYIKEYVQNYVEGFRRQVIESKPAPVENSMQSSSVQELSPVESSAVVENNYPSDQKAAVRASVSAKPDINVASIEDGSTPKVNLNDDVRATMSIGGVKASTYFASFANPDLAADRIALSPQGQDADLSVSPAMIQQQNSGSTYRARSMA